jgi:hypothetical protein
MTDKIYVKSKRSIVSWDMDICNGQPDLDDGRRIFVAMILT